MSFFSRARHYLYKGYLEEDEEISFVMHRHIVVEFKRFLKITFFGILIPLFFWWLFPEVALFAIAWLTIGAIRFIYEFLDWYHDVWLITNRSIIEIMWEGFFTKSFSRIEYHIIQLIGYDVKGLTATLFNYGTVTLELATGKPAKFDGAINPKKKSEMLTGAQEKFVTNKSFRDHRALQSVLTDMLQHHITQHGLPEDREMEEEEE